MWSQVKIKTLPNLWFNLVYHHRHVMHRHWVGEIIWTNVFHWFPIFFLSFYFDGLLTWNFFVFWDCFHSLLLHFMYFSQFLRCLSWWCFFVSFSWQIFEFLLQIFSSFYLIFGAFIFSLDDVTQNF
jgi:hypothetical protein